MNNELERALENLVSKMECHSTDLSVKIDETKERLNILEDLKNDAEDIVDRLGSLGFDIEDFIFKMEEVG